MQRSVRSIVSAFGSTILALLILLAAPAVSAQEAGTHHGGGEASLVLPDMGSVSFLGGIPGSTPGDFYAALNIVLPPADSETTNAFYHYMTEQFKSFKPRAGLGV